MTLDQPVRSRVALGKQDAKARGAFFTPKPVADFLASWAVRDPGDRVLEPSAGDGAIVSAVLDALGGRLTGAHVVAVEPDASDADRCRSFGDGVHVLQRDFFSVLPEDVGRIDAVLGNPPYIRYQRWSGAARAVSQKRASDAGVRLSSLASSWAAFVIYSCQFLSGDGRLGLVLPLELLSADYAEAVREYLPRRFTSVTVLVIDEPVFPDAEVATVLLLASADGPAGVRVQRIPRVHDLPAWLEGRGGPRGEGNDPLDGRWTTALSQSASATYAALLASGATRPLGDVASVDIGVVTGADRFFVVDPGEAATLGLGPDHLRVIVRRPGDLAGLRADPGETARLISVPKVESSDLSAGLRERLGAAEADGVHLRYKCRLRRPWYSISVKKTPPDAFFRYMNHDAARLVVNDEGALSTNLLHAVRLKPGAPPVRALAAAMLSSATRLSAEIEGRSYGGGVLKLETREAERVRFPVMSHEREALLAAAFDRLDGLLRIRQLETATAEVDALLGLDHDGLSAAIRILRGHRGLRTPLR